jgi:hypothetical protein
MVGAAWLLDRAAEVPDLFVEVLDEDDTDAATKGGRLDVHPEPS